MSRAAMERVIRDVGVRLSLLAEEYLDDSITLNRWRAESEAEIRFVHLRAAEESRVPPSVYSPVLESSVSKQLAFLSGAAEDIERAPQDERFPYRMSLYAQAARATYEECLRRQARLSGFNYERRILGSGSSHCDGCKSQAAKGWREIGTLKQIGQTECLVNCNCRFEYSRIKPFIPFSEDAMSDSVYLSAVQPEIRTPVPDLRQPNNFSCGATGLTSVAHYFGVGPRTEFEWEQLLGTDPDIGTPPDRIIRAAGRFGLVAEARHDMTLDQLFSEVENGKPVLCLIQAWGVPERYPEEEDGHYVVVIGFDEQRVIVEDPVLSNARGELSHYEFLSRWHDRGADGMIYRRFGIAFSKSEATDIVFSFPKAVPAPAPGPVTFAGPEHDKGTGKFKKKGAADTPGKKHEDAKKKLAKTQQSHAKVQAAHDEAKDSYEAWQQHVKDNPTDKKAKKILEQAKEAFVYWSGQIDESSQKLSKHQDEHDQAEAEVLLGPEPKKEVKKESSPSPTKELPTASKPSLKDVQEAGKLKNKIESKLKSAGKKKIAAQESYSAWQEYVQNNPKDKTAKATLAQAKAALDHWESEHADLTYEYKKAESDYNEKQKAHYAPDKDAVSSTPNASIPSSVPITSPSSKYPDDDYIETSVTPENAASWKLGSGKWHETFPPDDEARNINYSVHVGLHEAHDEYIKSQPESHKEALKYYTDPVHSSQDNGYKAVNRALNSGKEMNSLQKTQVHFMDDLINNAPPLPRPVVAWRGVGLQGAGLQKLRATYDSALASGNPVQVKSYSSTSIDPRVTDTFGDNFCLEIVAKRGLYVGDNSTVSQERELILPRDAQFRVVAKKKVYLQNGESRTVYQVEQL